MSRSNRRVTPRLLFSWSRHGLGRVPPALLVLAGMFALHTGSALAVRLFDAVGPAGVTWLRLTFAALLLIALAGPTLPRALRQAGARDLAALALLGTASGAMVLCFSAATARIPLGTASALEFLGPLVVAVAALRRRRDLFWIALAVVGVAALTRPWSGTVDPLGIAFGLAAAAGVAGYIVLTQRVGTRFGVLPGLAASMVVAAVVTAPLGAPAVLAHGTPALLAATLGVAVLYPLVPYLAEMVALRRMSRTAFSTFISLEPAVSLTMGTLILAQTPTPAQSAGLALVVIAGIGAARGDTPTATPPPRRRAGPLSPPGRTSCAPPAG